MLATPGMARTRHLSRLPMSDAGAVLVSLSAFGAAEVRRHGQLWFAQLAADAGADGFEVRGELLLDPATELPAMAKALPNQRRVYSSHEGLWQPDGTLDLAALERGLDAAQALQAPRLKMSVGGWQMGGPAKAAHMADLQARLARTDTELLIENDQTAQAGSLQAIEAFFLSAQRYGLHLGMTFDMGNWHWAGECPLQAAAACAANPARVRYVHCKGVQRQPQRWVAVPLAESSAPWRAVLRAMPTGLPLAIEYPLVGDDLLAVTRTEIDHLRTVARSFS